MCSYLVFSTDKNQGKDIIIIFKVKLLSYTSLSTDPP